MTTFIDYIISLVLCVGLAMGLFFILKTTQLI
nr:cytochrome b6-f complex subunit VI [Glaucosphaera vacuolata]UNJ18670.1 cytochrome b6-f complex subunit VI [Glaucosphaera vacuolata]